MSDPVQPSPRVETAPETSAATEAAGETSLLRVLWYPVLLFIAGPAIVMLAVKLAFGI